MKDFDAYFDFMEYASKKADQTRDNAQRKDKKNGDRFKLLKSTIDSETAVLADIEREIEETQKKINGQKRSMVNAMDITTQIRQYHGNIAKLNGLVSASRQVYKSKIDEEIKKMIKIYLIMLVI